MDMIDFFVPLLLEGLVISEKEMSDISSKNIACFSFRNQLVKNLHKSLQWNQNQN